MTDVELVFHVKYAKIYTYSLIKFLDYGILLLIMSIMGDSFTYVSSNSLILWCLQIIGIHNLSAKIDTCI